MIGGPCGLHGASSRPAARSLRRYVVARFIHHKEKPPESAASNSNLMIVDQTAINAGFDLRRYAMKPTLAKLRIIMPMSRGERGHLPPVR